MRLLTYDCNNDIRITRDLADSEIEPYAILSHTWGKDEEEVTFHEVGSKVYRSKAGFRKIDFCGQQAQRDGLQHFWVDTCCIDKTNHVELSEAITSMYRWYQNAHVCYVYLTDVASANGIKNAHTHNVSRCQSSFHSSRWFTRGWTLQELLAPKKVVFYSEQGEYLGTKETLKELLHEITSIPVAALENRPLPHFPVAERLRWADHRTTKKKEDRAYCLQGIFGVYLPLIYGEGDHAFVRLMEAINKDRNIPLSLHIVKGATFDAYEQTHRGCHPATRIDLLHFIQEWARDATGKNIFWLNGVAGTGKSTISWTVAKWLADLRTNDTIALGASFFFKRGEGQRASAASFFPTVASQLAASVENFYVPLTQAVREDPQISQKSLGEQFNKLIRGPLQRLTSHVLPRTYLVVVDALDECENESDIRAILQLWSTIPIRHACRLRLFLTSRPELVIRLGFWKMSTEVHQDLILHEIPRPVLQNDIHVYLTDALREVRTDYNLLLDDDLADEQLADDWPSSHVLQKLTDIAMPLFIIAATIHRLLRHAHHPQQRLETILQIGETAHLADVSQIYKLVLEAMTSSFQDAEDISQLYDDFRMIIGPIVMLAEPLSRSALAALLQITPSKVQICLRSLHAVLEIPSSGDKTIRPLHLSFGEFLNSSAIQRTPYWIDGLKKNMCHLEYSGKPRSEISPVQIEQSMRPEIRYACHYWVHHIQQSDLCSQDETEIYVFLKKHFLRWLEALSLMGKISQAINFIEALKSLLPSISKLSEFLADARRFTLANRHVADLAPLQLYYSAIIFSPQSSMVRNTCTSIPDWIITPPRVPQNWSLELQKIEGHTDVVTVAIFSPDNQLIASASADHTIRLWSSSAGQEIQRLNGHDDYVNALSFSPDGLLLASASKDQTVRVWNTKTGHQMQRLGGHTMTVSAVVYSPSGELLVSASIDKTIRVWDTSTWQEVLKLIEHPGSVTAVAFSSDGQLLASASLDQTIRLWNTTTWHNMRTLKGCTGRVNAVALSPNSQILASASDDCKVRLWKMSTGQKMQLLKDYSSYTHAVAFSPDSRLLASASWDGTVRLWDAIVGCEAQVLKGHTGPVTAVAFSHDGRLVVSASSDETIRTWQASVGQEVQRWEGHTNRVNLLSFSPDGQLLASAAVSDCTIRLWSTNTRREIHKLVGHTDGISKADFSPDSQLLASSSRDGTIRLWNANTGQELQRLEACHARRPEIAFSPVDQLLAWTAGDKTVGILDFGIGCEVQRLRSDQSWFYPVTFSPNGQLLASRSHKTIKVWDTGTWQEVQELMGNSVAFAPDGKLLATGSDETVTVWATDTWQDTRKVRTGTVDEIAIAPNNKVLATLTEDGSFKVWLIRTGMEVQHFLHGVATMTFTADSQTLLTNRGILRIDPTAVCYQPGGCSHESSITLNDEWLQWQGRDLLWLPQEYRTSTTAVYCNTVAFGHPSGRVDLLRLDGLCNSMACE